MEMREKVLFVVYRPEWWGCFDSLCRQECDRENVSCYVLPIPRYRRELQTKQVNYTEKYYDISALRGELPKSAVLADFETFSLEQKFDRIYIHNPYDDAGFVDAVDEKYCSWNLKNSAKKLIYVPHWLYIEGMCEDMVRCPVYKHVDAIYLSDDRVRYSLDVEYDSKVELVPSGILEYLDKLNAQKSAKSGKDRKRLLYCVSFHDLFYGTEKQIQKMWDIFEYMETRKDVEFVFRPDEDIRARYSELHGGIRRKYEELVVYFKEKEIGILDESLNPYQAAVEADGIMTAGHPMSSLFSVLGKYVLAIDRESRPIPTEEDRCIPSLWATTVEEKDGVITIWFVPEQTKLICRMTIPGGEVEIVSEVSDEVLNGLNYVAIEKVDNCLYLAPFASNGIWKYDLEKKLYSKQYVPNAEIGIFVKIISYEDYLYFIPRMYPGIVKYNRNTEEIKILDAWVAELESNVEPIYRNEPYFHFAVKQEENMLYMASAKCDVWMELDMATDEWKLENMELPGKRFATMVKEKDDVWLFPYGGTNGVWWNCRSKEKKESYVAKEFNKKDIPYGFAIELGNIIVALPKTDNDVLVISKSEKHETKEIKNGIPCRQEDYLSMFLGQKKIGYQFASRLRNGYILAYEYYDGSFLILDEKCKIIEKLSCRLPIEEIRKQYSIIIEREQFRNGFTGILYERDSFSAMLDFFVELKSNIMQEIRECYIKFID